MKKSLRSMAVCAAVVASLASVTPATAQPSGPPQASFYELTENMKLLGKRQPHRVAMSALAGTAQIGSAFCPSDLLRVYSATATTCTINALGKDNVNGTTGLGVFSAKLAVVVQGDNPTDPAEYVIDQITVGGPMNFSPALVQGLPYGTVTGAIEERSNLKELATFIGVFRLPFVAGPATRQALCPATPNPNPHFPGWDIVYVDTTPTGGLTGRCIDIRPEELSLGSPNVRFDIWFN